MPTDLPKTYDPASVEAAAYQTWLDEKCFAADPAAPGDPYCIVIPPPNVTGALHLGHAINTTLQDILIRMHRMAGFNTLWVPGIDHAGIATQAVRHTFFKLFKDGLIYRGKRLVNWDTFLQTSISDDEIYHETVKTNLWHIKYPIDGTDQYMIVATTRPETML